MRGEMAVPATMKSGAGVPVARSEPPDVRGSSGPVPLTIFGLGIASLLVLGIGTVGIQVDYATVAPALSKDCISVGVDQHFTGGAGVCHIVEGLRSTEERIVLGLAIAL